MEGINHSARQCKGSKLGHTGDNLLEVYEEKLMFITKLKDLFLTHDWRTKLTSTSIFVFLLVVQTIGKFAVINIRAIRTIQQHASIEEMILEEMLHPEFHPVCGAFVNNANI